MRGSYPRVVAVLFAAGFAGTVTNVSVTVVTSGLAREWNEPLSRIAAAILALNVSMAFAMPLAGLIAGRLGVRKVLIGGGVTLFASTVVLVFAEDLFLLTLGRLGQGAGLAAITPTAVQASNMLLTPREHARALGWWSAANGAGLALGPVMGGTLLDLSGWSLVPMPTILIAAFVTAASAIGIPAGRRHEGRVRLYGAVMLSLIAGMGVALLSALSIGAWPPAVAIGVVLTALVTYALLGGRRGELPLSWLDDMIVRRSGTGASLQMFVNGVAQVGVPAWLVTEAITSSGGAGALLLAMTITMTIMGPLTGRAADVVYRRWFLWGAGLCAAGSLGLTAAAGSAVWWLSLPALVVTGVGAGSLLTPSFQAFSTTVAGSDGVGLAIYNLLRLSSFAVGGIIAAAAVDAEMPWAGFLVAAALCLVATTRSSSGLTISSPSRAGDASVQ